MQMGLSPIQPDEQTEINNQLIYSFIPNFGPKLWLRMNTFLASIRV